MGFGAAFLRSVSPRFLRKVGFSVAIYHGTQAFHQPECMPRRGGGGRQDQPAANPATDFQHITGTPALKIEDHLELPANSSLVTAFPFIQWKLTSGPPATAAAPRSKVVGVLLPATSRPSLLDLSRLETLPFISNEVTTTEATKWATELHAAGAFDTVYPRFVDWVRKAKSFTAAAQNPDNLYLKEDSFEEITAWDNANGPNDLGYLSRISLADLVNADARLSDESFQPHTLTRATVMLGSKDNQTERDDESSTVRLASEVVTGLVKKDLSNPNASAAGVASRFVSMLRDVQLTPTFCMHNFSANGFLREFELGYKHAHSTPAEAFAIEAELFLNVGNSYPVFKPLLEKFSSGPEAAVEFNRLSAQLLPATISSSPYLVRLPSLSELLGQASWRAAVTHLINTHSTSSGSELISALIRMHTEVAQSSTGGGSASHSSAPLLAGPSDSSSYGSIREQSIGDALRSKESIDALSDAAEQSGIERVETIMQSNSVLLTRAMLLQEAWLHNKHATLAFCSLDQPYLCPYFASALTEDTVSGTVPARLASYTFPASELAILRSKDWSKLSLLGEALKIRTLQYGSTYAPVKGRDVYTVESCLRLIKEHGTRLFFACNLSLAPSAGYSFGDGVDLQLEAVEFAQTLPKTECTEWLTFLNQQFKENWLDAGGLHYHSKLRSGRPDSEEARLSEFMPLENCYFGNVKTRMKRAEPVAEFRIAFPTMFAGDTIALPGTSSSQPNVPSGKKNRNGKDKEKGNADKRLFQSDATGPGSKSKLAMPISNTELWLGGVVFKKDKITSHFKVANADHLCWPVILSKKKGDAALELCPDHATHGDMKQPVHKRPNNFDLDYIYKNFTRAATAAENKKAGWEKVSRNKKQKN